MNENQTQLTKEQLADLKLRKASESVPVKKIRSKEELDDFFKQD